MQRSRDVTACMVAWEARADWIIKWTQSGLCKSCIQLHRWRGVHNRDAIPLNIHCRICWTNPFYELSIVHKYRGIAVQNSSTEFLERQIVSTEVLDQIFKHLWNFIARVHIKMVIFFKQNIYSRFFFSLLPPEQKALSLLLLSLRPGWVSTERPSFIFCRNSNKQLLHDTWGAVVQFIKSM